MKQTELQAFLDRFHKVAKAPAIIATLLLVAGGIALLLKSRIGEVDGVVFVALLLFPLIGYLVLTDKIEEFSFLGGGAKLKKAVESPPVGEDVVVQIAPWMWQKGSLDDLRKYIQPRYNRRHANLTIKLGAKVRYDPHVLNEYLCELLSMNAEPIVIFVDSRDRFIGCISATQLHAVFCEQRKIRSASSTEDKKRRVMAQLNDPRVDRFDALPITYDYLVESDTRADALRIFKSTGARVLVVVNSMREPIKIVPFDQLIGTLLLGASEDSSKSGSKRSNDPREIERSERQRTRFEND